jgi:hypothetical protein
MTRQAVTPADLLGRIEMLNVVCSKCERRGRYRVQSIIRQPATWRGLSRHGGTHVWTGSRPSAVWRGDPGRLPELLAAHARAAVAVR